MKVLALETSGRSGSVALLERTDAYSESTESNSESNSELIFEQGLDENVRTAAGMAPLIQSLLAEAGWVPGDVDLIAVMDGPGSFTGLRVGITTAKVFAYAVGAEVLDVNSLHVIAHGCASDRNDLLTGPLSVIMDAQRKQLFRADFNCDDGVAKLTDPCRIVDGDRWIEGLGDKTRVAGPGLGMKLVDGRTVIEHLTERGLAGAAVPPSQWIATAASVGRLALADYAEGRRADLWKLAPSYFRLSAAEESAMKNHQCQEDHIDQKTQK